LVHQSSGCWGIPKGQRNKNEAQIECAIREVVEETGLDIREKIDKDKFIENNRKTDRYYIVVVDKSQWSDFKISDTNEIEEVKWVPIEDISKYNLNSITRHVVKRIQADTLTL
jgi:mRNA-decapping enzyme subunit 2